MLRPKLRPTLSRKIKYLLIAPNASKKLGREARRGSHDLRKLVGHANFLDVLVSELDINDDEEEEVAASSSQERVPVGNGKDGVEREEEKRENEQDTSHDDEWSEYDNSDEDETQSPQMTSVEGIGQRTAMTIEREDYFHLVHPVIAVEDALITANDKKDVIVSVTIASDVLTPPISPTDELELVGAK